jgi:hypothetical protein
MSKTKLIDAYHLGQPITRGTGREGHRWTIHLLVGTSKVAEINDDGNGGSLRWTWVPFPKNYKENFTEVLDEWIKSLCPGTTIKDYYEADAAWVMASMISGGFPDVRDAEALKQLKLQRVPKRLTYAPNWTTLENRLVRLVHSMKLGYSSMMSLGYPLQDIMTSQKIAIHRIEDWIAEGKIDVDNWQTLDGCLDGCTVSMWCCYNADWNDRLPLGFSQFSPVAQWDTIVAPMIKLTVLYRAPVYEATLPQEARS